MSYERVILRPRLVLLSLLLLTTISVPARATVIPTGFTESVFLTGINNPTAIAFAPDGRLFFSEQTGKLRVVTASGTLLPTPFVDLTAKISQGDERGLLGIAFDPNFAVNQYVYVYYTASAPAPHNRVSRFVANGNVTNPNSEQIIFDLDNLNAEIHNSGAIHFGIDGKLYVASGDNGTSSNAQTLSNTLGKILRLNPNPANPIPADNPFVSQTTGKSQAIYALGFRNPFRFAIHPVNGRIFADDVGLATIEEVDDVRPGGNYGWPVCEGPCSDARFINPLYAYTHAEGCAVTGGVFDDPRVAQLPAGYEGNYFFGDLCGGWVRRIDTANGNTVSGFAFGYGGLIDLAFSPNGALYVLRNHPTAGTSIVKIQYQTANQAPVISLQPTSITIGVGQTASFTVSATGSVPLTYQWQKNGSDIPGATSSTYTTPAATLADNGAIFRSRVTNAFGNAISNAATLTVAGRPPTASIVTPTVDTFYTAGQPVSFSGVASDPEDGTLPPSAFTWDVDFGHNDTAEHFHPFDPPVSGITSGTFLPSQTDEVSPNVWYRIKLTVKDSQNLTFTTYHDIFPRKAMLTLATNPPGLQLTLDGTPTATPRTVEGVVGIIRTLGAPSSQTVGGQTYVFTSWSDGGAATHTIATPSVNTTYTANFQLQSGGTSPVIPQSQLRVVSVDSQEASRWQASYAIDGSADSFWHTAWVDASPAPPHQIILDLGGSYNVRGFRYLPRQDGIPNGTIKDYQFYVSTDGVSWGSPIQQGSLAGDATLKEVVFGTSGTGRFIRLVALSDAVGSPYTAIAELNILGTAAGGSSPVIPQSQLRLVSVDSQEAPLWQAGYAIDGSADTFWHTAWVNTAPAHPHQIILDLGGSYSVRGFRYLPRQDGLLNGTIKDYQFYVSSDGVSWGSPVQQGSLAPTASLKEVVFGTPRTGRFIRLVALSDAVGLPYTAIAELNILGTAAGGSSPVIPQSQLRLVSVDSQEAPRWQGSYAIDGAADTFWHTAWMNASPAQPHQIILDLGGSYSVRGFRYLPRQDGLLNGTIKDYQFYVSSDGVSWGSPVQQGSLAPTASLKEVVFGTPRTGRFIRLVALSDAVGLPYTAIAELNILGTTP